MDSKKVELFWEHPTKFIVGLFLAVAVLCVLLVYMPEWFRIAAGVLFVIVFIKMVVKLNAKERKAQQKMENLGTDEPVNSNI